VSNAAKVLDVIENSLGATVYGIARSTALDVPHVERVAFALVDAGLVQWRLRPTMGGNKVVFHPTYDLEA